MSRLTFTFRNNVEDTINDYDQFETTLSTMNIPDHERINVITMVLINCIRHVRKRFNKYKFPNPNMTWAEAYDKEFRYVIDFTGRVLHWNYKLLASDYANVLYTIAVTERRLFYTIITLLPDHTLTYESLTKTRLLINNKSNETVSGTLIGAIVDTFVLSTDDEIIELIRVFPTDRKLPGLNKVIYGSITGVYAIISNYHITKSITSIDTIILLLDRFEPFDLSDDMKNMIKHDLPVELYAEIDEHIRRD